MILALLYALANPPCRCAGGPVGPCYPGRHGWTCRACRRPTR